MTGLDLAKDALVEVAVLVTDGELNIQGQGVDIVIQTPEAALEQMNDFVREMHTKSGLLDEIRAATTTMREAEEQVMAYIRQYVPEPRKAPLGGNSVGTDRTFLNRDMPEFEDFVHYRNVDVSTIKELARRWYPKAFYNAPEKHGNHRALADIIESVQELRYFREAVMVPEPGPDTATAKMIAARYVQATD
jgi:oligoribonuclease